MYVNNNHQYTSIFSLHSSSPHLVATRIGGESRSEGSVVLGPPVRMSPTCTLSIRHVRITRQVYCVAVKIYLIALRGGSDHLHI